MAQQGIQMDQEKLCCSICLDILKAPVTISCGHNYCMSCIKSHWDGEDQKGTYSCPQCRQAFRPRPVLEKNTMLADLVDDLKKSGLPAAPADLCYAEAGDVACDFCTGRKLKATKSCLQCLVSYCEQHLQPHYESPAFKKHKLVHPSEKLQENICTRHSEVMKMFCRTDQQSICFLCYVDEHKGHDTVSAEAERTEKQRELGESQQRIQQRIQAREKDVKVLQQELETVNRSADKAVRDSEKIFTDAKQQIRSRQRTEVGHINKLQEKLQQEIADLKRKDTELDQLSHTEDHNQFLHSYTLLCGLGEAADSPSINNRPPGQSEDMSAAVSEARQKLQDVLSEEWNKTTLASKEVDGLLPQAELKTRDEFFKYSCGITLDQNTANKYIMLVNNSKRAIHNYDYNRSAKFIHTNSWRPNTGYYCHPDSFTDWCQVLCREVLNDCCYWEVEWEVEVFVAVTYKSISRTGRESAFGYNDMSWALQCFQGGYEFRHNNIITPVKGPQSSRVGVYLDHRAGVLSFYSVSDTMTLLHRVHTRFTQPLCPGLGIHVDSGSAEIFNSSYREELDDLSE